MKNCCAQIEATSNINLSGRERDGFISKVKVSTEDDQIDRKHALRSAAVSDTVLAAVIVTICSGSTYDALFSQVEQKGEIGTHVNTYSVDGINPNFY